MNTSFSKVDIPVTNSFRLQGEKKQPLLNASEEKDNAYVVISKKPKNQCSNNLNLFGMGDKVISHPKYEPTLTATFIHSLNTTIFLTIPSGIAVKNVEPLFHVFGGIATLNFVTHTVPGLWKDYRYPGHKNDLVPPLHKKKFQLARAAMETINTGLIISAVFLANMWSPNGPKNYELFTGVLGLSGLREIGGLAKAYINQDPWLFVSNALHVGFIVSAAIAINFKNEGGVLSDNAQNFELNSAYVAGAFSAAMVFVTMAHYYIAGHKEPQQPLLDIDSESELDYVTLGI